MSIVEYIKEYIEDKGTVCRSKDEYAAMITGIKLYLRENGIDETEEREYYQKFVSAHLRMVDDGDLKDYFICYETLSRINSIVIKARDNDATLEQDKEALRELMDNIRMTSIGDKYVPMDEVRHFLAV